MSRGASNSNNGMGAEFYNWLRSLDAGKLLSASTAVAAVADFSVDAREDQPFVDFVNWINESPKFIAAWRSDPALETRCYHRFMQGLDACRSGYAAARYHLSRQNEIEHAIHLALEPFDFSERLQRGTTTAFSATRKLHYEYQAFVLAYRRSLDGLAYCLSTFFRQEQTSFRRFCKVLPKYHPASVAIALAETTSLHISKFDFVIADERGKSVRDRIAHREAVQAGTINVGTFGTQLVGGGENLLPNGSGNSPRLCVALEGRMIHLNDCIRDLLETFRTQVISHESI